MDALVADKILSYLPVMYQIATSRGLGAEAVKIIREYRLTTDNIESGEAYFIHRTRVDWVYEAVSMAFEERQEHIRDVLVHRVMQLMTFRPELAIVWNDMGDAEDMIVRVIRDYLYLNETATNFIARKCELNGYFDMSGDDLAEPIYVGYTKTFRNLLRQLIERAQRIYGVIYSRRLSISIGGMHRVLGQDEVFKAYYY